MFDSCTAADEAQHGRSSLNGHHTTTPRHTTATLYTVEALATSRDMKRRVVKGEVEWYGPNPSGQGATEDGFVLKADGKAFERNGRKYTSPEVAQLFGISSDQYAPCVEYSTRNGHHTNGHKPAQVLASTPKPADRKPLREIPFDYTDEGGQLLYQAVRREFDDGSKSFLQRKRDERGTWAYKLGEVRRVLYRLPEVLAAETVFVVEGEKCAELLNAELDQAGRLGECVATTNAAGAGQWGESYSTDLAGKRVVFLPDNDEAGEKHTAKACPSIARAAGSLQVLRLPDLPAKGDVADFFEAGGTLTEVLALAEAAPDWAPEIKAKAEEAPAAFQFEFTTDADLDDHLNEISWLWPGFIPRGLVTGIVAGQDQGKSTVAQNLCDIILRGTRWPDGQPHTPEPDTKLLWIDTEGSLALFHQRAKAWGMPRGRFILPSDPLQELAIDDAENWQWIEAAIERFRPPLVVIDALSGAHRHGKENGNDEMKPIMKKLASLAQRHNIAIIVIHHLNKPAPGVSEFPITIHRLRGATAIPQYCRSIIALGTPDTSRPNSRRLDVIKLNLCPKPEPIGYELGDHGPEWGAAPEPPKPRRAVDDAIDFLQVALANGRRPADEVQAEARAQGIGGNALNDAKKALRVEAKREGGKDGRWFWTPHGFIPVSEEVEEGEV